MTTADDPAATGNAKIVPRLARIAFGLKRSVRASAAITASAPAPSAVRRIAPRLPGFSTASTTTTSGSAGRSAISASSDVDGERTIATTPSDRSPNASFPMTASETEVNPVVAASRPTASRASSDRTSSSQTNASATSTPWSRARSSSRGPSTIVRPVDSRSRRSRSRTAALTRGFVRLVSVAGRVIGR